MIENVTYRCEVCGATYNTRPACAACENFHAKLPTNANAIEGANYLARTAANLPFPVRLMVRFADGRKALYDFVADVTPTPETSGRAK